MNKIMLIGRLTRDPEVRYSQENETGFAKFNLAVDRRFTREGQPTADFFSCVAFKNQAAFVEKYLDKGIKVVVVGRMENNNYISGNGNKVYGYNLIVEELEFAESKRSRAGNNYGSGNSTQTDSDFVNIPDEEDLPFR